MLDIEYNLIQETEVIDFTNLHYPFSSFQTTFIFLKITN